MSDAKALHEDGALQALVNELKARGRDARMTSRPDIDGAPGPHHRRHHGDRR